MASIYELTNELRTLWDLIEDGTLDEDALADAFTITVEDLSIKLEAYCKFIKNAESDIEGIRAEEKRLAAKRRAMENAVKRAKQAMQDALRMAGEKKIKAGSFTVSVQNNPPKVVFDDPYIENIPSKYLIPTDPDIDVKKILEDLKAGADGLEGIAHLEQSESLRIR